MGLNTKQQAFVEHYFVCWNATEAARRAGYSEKTAYSIGSENLRKPEISEAIRARLQQLHMTADEVLARLADQARGDIGEFLELPTKNIRNHPRSHLLKKVKRTVTTVYIGEAKEVTETVELEMYDAQAALTQIGRHHKLFVDKLEVDWRKEAEAAGLNPDDYLEQLTREFEQAINQGAERPDAGSLGTSEGAGEG